MKFLVVWSRTSRIHAKCIHVDPSIRPCPIHLESVPVCSKTSDREEKGGDARWEGGGGDGMGWGGKVGGEGGGGRKEKV